MAVYYKMRQLLHYKMREKVITQCVRFFITKYENLITNCNIYSKLQLFFTKSDSYDKMQRLLQIATVQYSISTELLLNKSLK